MRGLRRVWERGERRVVSAVNGKGQTVVRLGKNGGPVIEQRVVLHLVPKDGT